MCRAQVSTRILGRRSAPLPTLPYSYRASYGLPNILLVLTRVNVVRSAGYRLKGWGERSLASDSVSLSGFGVGLVLLPPPRRV